MFYACDQRFDVTGNFENFFKLNKASEREKREKTNSK